MSGCDWVLLGGPDSSAIGAAQLHEVFTPPAAPCDPPDALARPTDVHHEHHPAIGIQP